MRFASPLVGGHLIRRYKRFLADVTLADGREITAHCANPGAMMGLASPGNPVWMSLSTDPKRKLSHSLELVEVDFGWIGPQLVGVNTAHPNRIVAEAIRDRAIAELAGYETLRPEMKYGANSRVDFLLTSPGKADAYVEVKNVHLMRNPGLAEFPDCVTARGAKHLAELTNMVANGHRAVMLYVIQMQAEGFNLARDLDPAYAAAFAKAKSAGVEAYAYTCRVTADEIVLDQAVPVLA
jgi:sugar fermentation stimulation protein A